MAPQTSWSLLAVAIQMKSAGIDTLDSDLAHSQVPGGQLPCSNASLTAKNRPSRAEPADQLLKKPVFFCILIYRSI